MTFQECLDQILKFEGGYTNDPKDPGGETNLGISKRSYPHLDIKSLTPATVAPIYKADFWDKVGCDALPSPLDFLAFDCAVNQGPGACKEMLSVAGNSPVVFTRERLNRYQREPGWKEYGAGWASRLVQGLLFVIQE